MAKRIKYCPVLTFKTSGKHVDITGYQNIVRFNVQRHGQKGHMLNPLKSHFSRKNKKKIDFYIALKISY